MENFNNFKDYEINEGLKYHLEKNIPLNKNIYRPYSESYYELLSEARKLFERGLLDPRTEDELIILEKLKTGKKGKFKGETVRLDSPKYIPEDSDKKFRVYVDSGKKDKEGNIKAKKIEFGDPNSKVRNYDKKAAKSFRARHKCADKKDKKTAGWWSCNIHLFADELGLSSDRPW